MIYIKIGGIVDISTKDIPGMTSMVIFTVGCNFKCDLCHNKHLLSPRAGNDMKISELINRIKSNNLIRGVSITGGEPTLQSELKELCQQAKKAGKYVSIDTNGSHPEVMSKIIPYLDRVALDLKVSPTDNETYDAITGIKTGTSEILQTFEMIRNIETLKFEIRTTYIAKHIKPSGIEKILNFLKSRPFKGNYVIQQYQYSEGVGDLFKEAFQKPSHLELLSLIEPLKNETYPFDIFLRDDYSGYQLVKPREI